jgi:ketosteroid isomerase-like protein
MHIPRCHTLMIIFIVLLGSCTSTGVNDKASEELIKADKAFSKLSEEKGMNTAFLSYIAEEAVLLRPNKQPIKGKQKIQEIYSKPDSTFTLTWEPLFAEISRSGELGYTYGIYNFESYGPDGLPVVEKGTYATFWEKNDDGAWKFVLDTGNPGLGE